MAFSKYILTFTEVPAVNDYLEIVETSTSTNLKETFKVNRLSAKQTKVPAGIDIGPGPPDPPTYLYSGYVSTNYKTAFNLDYNTTGQYAVTSTTGASGSGIGTVTVEATFPGAVFEEVNVPDGVTVEIFNEEYIPVISITDVEVSASGTPCSLVSVQVTTDLLAVEVLSPVAVNPNADNPFIFDWARGETITISVKDADDNVASQDLTTPPVLDTDLFTIDVVESFAGAAVTINNTLAPGLILEYSLNGIDFQSSNAFTGVDIGPHTVIIRDNFGCSIAKDFTVAGLLAPLILGRSPYFCKIGNAGIVFDSATMDLRVWRGNSIADYPATPTQPFSKSVIQAGQEQIIFDISRVAGDFVKNKYSHNPQGVGAFTSQLADSVWVETDSTALLSGVAVVFDKKRYLLVDGFGYHVEGANPPVNNKVLSTITRHIYYGTNYPIYFVTDGLTSIVINGVSVPFTFSQEESNQLVAFVNAAAYAGVSTTFTAVFSYGASSFVHSFEKRTECKYQVYNCYFKNKYGVWQNIAFNKVSKDSIAVTSSEFQGNVLQGDGTYNLNAHVTKTFGVEGKGKVILNTDNTLPEEYYLLFKELHYSEMVYIETGGLCLPVNFSRKDLDKKTKIKDRLIQYSEEFLYSFNDINSIL